MPLSGHQQAAEAARSEVRRDPVWSADQCFRAAEIHAFLAIEARLAQVVGGRPDLVVSQ
jgi:hypothetical protein